jgi:hypothetical protein
VDNSRTIGSNLATVSCLISQVLFSRKEKFAVTGRKRYESTRTNQASGFSNLKRSTFLRNLEI